MTTKQKDFDFLRNKNLVSFKFEFTKKFLGIGMLKNLVNYTLLFNLFRSDENIIHSFHHFKYYF